jgi:hypothetical protein
VGMEVLWWDKEINRRELLEKFTSVLDLSSLSPLKKRPIVVNCP